MAGYLADVRKAKNYAEFKKMHPDVDITREGFLDLKRGDRRRRLRQPETLQPSGRHGQPEAGFLNRNDGGMAKKTRTF